MTPLYLRVRELRTAKGLSQVELAELAGVRQGTISAIENAKTKRLEFEVLERLANALDVDPALLLAQSGKRRK